MKQESNVRYVLRLALTLLAICAVVSGLLAGVNAITKDRIAAIKAEKTAKAISAVLENGETAVEVPYTTEGDTIVVKVYQNENGYAVQVAPQGFGGAITMMVGVDLDGKVTGISIISHAETPGLGAIAAAKTDKGNAFRDQFIGLVAGITVGDGDNQIEAISGATISSKAIADGVNAALSCVANMG
jgi:electron transport complex protein RnfG